MTQSGLTALLAEISALDPVDERESASIARILADAPGLAEPFDEEAGPVHLTASGFVVGNQGTILHLHRKLGIWVQPGGHIDPGEAPLDAAVRETREETGLGVISIIPEGLLFHVDVHPGPRGHIHFDLRYVLGAPDDDPTPPPEESQDVRWCAFADVATLAERSLVPALTKLGAAWMDPGCAWREKVEQMQDRRREMTT